MDVRHPQAASDATDTFEAEGLLGEPELVIVKPMIETDTSLRLRAKEANVPLESLRAKTYGLKIYVLSQTPDIGPAFLQRKQIYHLDERGDQLVIDEAYWYSNGFVSSDIIRVTEKSWSEYYLAEAGDIEHLDTLAEAVRSGTGQRDAYEAMSLFGRLAKFGSPAQNKFERDVTWIAGMQSIEDVRIELQRSHKFGNQLSARFVR